MNINSDRVVSKRLERQRAGLGVEREVAHVDLAQSVYHDRGEPRDRSVTPHIDVVVENADEVLINAVYNKEKSKTFYIFY